jgi:hypothetical protein
VTQQESAPWRSARCTTPSSVGREGKEGERLRSQESAPYLVWALSLALLSGLSGCGPGTPDPSPSVDSRASRSEPSAAQAGPQPTASLSPLAPAEADGAEMSDEVDWLEDVPEPPVSLSLANGWTQEGAPEAVAVPEDPIDDAAFDAAFKEDADS